MQRGIHYVGVCANAKHQAWLQNVVDRAALKQIMTQQMPLYDASLAAQIKEYFMDIVSSHDMQGGAEDDDDEDDDNEDGVDEGA